MILNLLNNLKLFNFNTYSNLNKQFIHSSSLNYRKLVSSEKLHERALNNKAKEDAKKLALKQKEKARKEKEKEKLRLKKEKEANKIKLRSPKAAPSPWQVLFTEELIKARDNTEGKIEIGPLSHAISSQYKQMSNEEKQKYIDESKRLKLQQEKEYAAYLQSIPLKDIKHENKLRHQLRKQGKKGLPKIKDPNAPKRPLTAYFDYLKDIRSNSELRLKLLGDKLNEWKEASLTDKSKIAADKWKSLSEDLKNEYKSKHELAKHEYEEKKKVYETSKLN